MLDAVAKLTSALRHASKRRAPGDGELDSGVSLPRSDAAADRGMKAARPPWNARAAVAAAAAAPSQLFSNTVCASQVEESQLQLGYDHAQTTHAPVRPAGGVFQPLDAGEPLLRRLFLGET